MKRITINNASITTEKAIKEAEKFYKETGKPVEVSNMLGDAVFYITKEGKKIKY